MDFLAFSLLLSSALKIEGSPHVGTLMSNGSCVEQKLMVDKCDVNVSNPPTSEKRLNGPTPAKRERRKRYKRNLRQRKKQCLEV